MLRFSNLQKSFGNKTVLANLNAELKPGCYAVQGANGCGKSTLLAVLAGILPADAGVVVIDGHDLCREPVRAKSCLAYVPDESPIYPFMTGRELLHFVAGAKSCAVTDAVWTLADEFELDVHLDTAFAAMSLGTQKKMLLTAAWIGAPRVMLMDEPCNGLDRAARGVLARAAHTRREDCVMLMSTHDAEFVAAMGATTIAFESLAGYNA